MVLGFSTGGLKGLAVAEVLRLYRASGLVRSVELCLASPAELNAFDAGRAAAEGLLAGFQTVTVHAPFKGLRYDGGDGAMAVISALQRLCAVIPVRNVVFHPDVVDDFSQLAGSGLPVSIENMDRNKTSGRDPAELLNLVRTYGFKMTFDLDHAYGIDPGLTYASELVRLLGGDMVELHISGESQGQNHSLLYCSGNSDALIRFYHQHSLYHLIEVHEGRFTDFHFQIRQETDFFLDASARQLFRD